MPVTGKPSATRWVLLGLLWGCFLLHQGDRQAFNAVIPLIREGLGLSDVQIGWVGTGFSFVYGLLVPFAGYFGDLFPKKRVVIMSLLMFSAGTLLTGFAGGFWTLLLFRSFATGAGESIYYPSGSSMIAERFFDRKALALGIHQSANYIGVVGSGVLAGWIGSTWGWRMTFVLFGAAGLVWAVVLALGLRDTGRASVNVNAGAGAAVAAERGPRVGEALKHVLGCPSFYFIAASFGCLVFVVVGYTTWMPAILHERFAMPLARSGFHSTFLHYLLAFAGVMAAGAWSDRLVKRHASIRIDTGWLGLLCAAPFIVLMAYTESFAWLMVGLAGFGLFRGIYDSNCFAVLFEVVAARYRATASGLMLGFGFASGSFASVVLGAIKQHRSASDGLLLLAVMFVLGGVLLLTARLTRFQRDRERALTL